MHPWRIHVMWKVEIAKATNIPLVHSVSTYSQSVSSPSQNCCPVLSSGIKHNYIQQEQLLFTPVPWSSQTRVSSTIVVRRLRSGMSPHSIQRVGAKGGPPDSKSEKLGYSGSSLLSQLSLSSINLLYSENFS